MKKVLVLVVFFIMIFFSIEANTGNNSSVDSLIIKLESTHHVDEKIDIYIRLSTYYKDLDITKSMSYSKQALLLAEKINSIENLGVIYAHLGELALVQDSIEVAENQFIRAADYLSKAKKPMELITVYLSIGNRYIEKDNYADALKYYLKGIELSEEAKIDDKLANLYNNLGIVYLNINKTEEALDLYSKSLSLFTKKGDTMNIAGTTTNIGSIYIQLGQKDIAESYYKLGYQLFKNFGSLEGMAHSLLKLGLLELLRFRYDSAAIYIHNSLSIQRELEVTLSGSKSFFMAETLINLGIAYYHLHKYDEARDHLSEGYTIAESTNQYRLIALSSEYLSKYYEVIKENDQAFEYFKVFKQYSDSSFNEENVRKLTQIEMQYQFDAQIKQDEIDQKLKLQQQERKNFISIAFSAFLFLMLVIVVLLLRLEKAKKRKAELERKSLTGQLEHANKELTTYVMYLLRKNEFIISIAEKLKLARLDAKTENKKIIAQLIKELEANSNLISWEEFEVRFQQVYTGFYKKLSGSFPDLTPNELRLCAFFRLNMTTKEIAAITYQSINSLTMARYRLRKKLGISSDENLVVFLTQF